MLAQIVNLRKHLEVSHIFFCNTAYEAGKVWIFAGGGVRIHQNFGAA